MATTSHPSSSHQNLAAALDYGRRGWAVVPLHTLTGDGCSCGRLDCSSPGKHPRIKTGADHSAASTDAEQISQWWSLWPDANIGLVTGRRSGLLVVDVDPRHGGA